MEILFKEKIDEQIYKIINEEFTRFADKNLVQSEYVSFGFVAKENDKIVGVITAHTFYKDVHVDDLIVLEDYRKKDIGTQLLEAVENYCKNEGFDNINLTTYAFQAPEFYKKCGYEVEFIREDRKNPKLNKYFFIKYL